VAFIGFGLDLPRREAVRDGLEEERCFIMCRSAKGNDSNNILRFGVHNGDGDSAKQPEGYEALLVVTEPVVFVRDGQATNTISVSAKLKPRVFRLDLRLASSHSNRIYRVYIHCRANATVGAAA
jgi:hypothetical protein